VTEVSSAPGTIITFYSYKGGTGRSMMLANVAWLLANSGKRVLVVDWDLEAPGLHQYFLPFLNDKDLTSSNGVIDFVIDFAVKAADNIKPGTGQQKSGDMEWIKPYANILRYASSLKWDFPTGGALDFVPAGRQGASYSTRVNSFNWQHFYDLLGGGPFFEAVKKEMRSEYDYILIDSRTGVSDTSGICTVQMPDILVTCFTLNGQSIEGASTVAKSVFEQRKGTNLRIFPVPTRTDNAELEKRLLRLEYARDVFDSVLTHIPSKLREDYWGEVEVHYVPFYSYEEMLATFRDLPSHRLSLLASFEHLTRYLTDGSLPAPASPEESLRESVLAQFTSETLFNYDLFISHAPEDAEIAESIARRLSKEKVQGRRLRIYRPPSESRESSGEFKKHQSALSRSRRIIIVVSPALIELDEGERLPNTQALTDAEPDKVISIYYRDADIPTELRSLRFIDFRNRSEFSSNINKVLEVVRDPVALDSLPTFELAVGTLSITQSPDLGFVPRRDRDGRNLIEWLKEALAGTDMQAVVLWGAGGVGKTTLAAEAIRYLDGPASRRVIWFSADEYSNPNYSTLLDDILTKLDQTQVRTLPDLQKSALLRSLISTTPSVIVIDGFERISTDGQTEIERDLINMPPCALLITSRQRVSSARNVVLSGFSLEETSEYIDRWTKVRAVNVAVSKEQSRIYNLTEGIPLALHLVLGFLNLHPNPKAALSEMEKMAGEAVERSFRLSYDSLATDRDSRLTLLALSLFVPNASLPALTEVTGFIKRGGRIDKALARLQALGLVDKPADKKRFGMHELARTLTRSRLVESKSAAQLQVRFIAYFLKYTLAPTADVNALDLERDNILTAVNLAFENGDWTSVLEFGRAIALPGQWLRSRGYLDDAIRCSEQSWQAAFKSKASSDVLDFAISAAEGRQERREFSRAAEIYHEALTMLAELQDHERRAIVLHRLGELSTTQANYPAAIKYYEESLQMGQSTPETLAANLASISEVALLQHDLEKALVNLQEALAIVRKGDDQRQVALYSRRLGEIAVRLGKLDVAEEYLTESLRIFRTLTLPGGVAAVLSRLGNLQSLKGAFEAARALYQDSLEIERQLDDQHGIASTLHGLGRVAQNQGELEEAARLFNESLSIRERLGDQRGIAYSLSDLAMLAQQRSDFTEARQFYYESLDILRSIRDSTGIASALRQLGRICETEDNLTEAARQFQEAVSIYESIASPLAKDASKDLERVERKLKKPAKGRQSNAP
jgi:tetratricopeptide (TPR) repeat protein